MKLKLLVALFLPFLATWMAVTAWGFLAVYSPLGISLWRRYPELVAFSSLALVLLPCLGAAAWLFCRAVVNRPEWSFVAAFVGFMLIVAPFFFEPFIWATSTTYLTVGLWVVFPAFVWLTSRSNNSNRSGP